KLVVSICIKIRKNKFKTIKKRHLFRCFFYFINSFPDLDFVLFLPHGYELVQIRSFYVLNCVFFCIVLFFYFFCLLSFYNRFLCHFCHMFYSYFSLLLGTN